MKIPWYVRVQNIPRSLIYSALVIVFIIPLVKPLRLPLTILPNTKAAFQFVDGLPAGSIVFHSIGFNPAVDAEVWPQMVAMTRHYMQKHLKIIFFPFAQEGTMYAARIRDSVAPNYHYEYGKDYVILPFVAGGESAIAGLNDFYSLFNADEYGTSLRNIPFFKGFKGISDVSVIVANTGGDDVSYYLRQVKSEFGIPLIAAGTAPVLPVIGPFLASGQVKGAVIGLAGAAEYEVLAKVPGKATSAMDAQSMGHLLIVFLIALGNLGYLVQRHSRRGPRETKMGGERV